MNEITVEDYNKTGLTQGFFNGTPIFVKKIASDESGRIVMCDVVGSDMVLQAIIASIALNDSAACIVYVNNDGGKETVWLGNRGLDDDGSKKESIPVEHQMYRLGHGLGALSRLIVLHKELTGAINTEKSVSFAVIGNNDEESARRLKGKMNNYLPLSLPDGMEEKCVEVMRENDDITPISGFGVTGDRVVLDRGKLFNTYLPSILEKKVTVQTETMLDFIDRCGDTLVSVIRDKMKPVFDMKHDQPDAQWVERIDALTRTPFETQKNCIYTLAAAHKQGMKGAFTIGEMSTGKTTMGIATAMVINPKGVHIVMCPPQLTRKWEREIKAVAGNHVNVKIIEDWKAAGILIQFAKDLREEKTKLPLFLVISRTRTRMYEFWEPSFIERRLSAGELEGNRLMSKRAKYVACPACFEHHTETETLDSGEEVERHLTAYEMRELKRRIECKHCGSPLWQNRHEKVGHKDMSTQRYDMMKRWISEIPGISAKKACDELDRVGVNELARELKNHKFTTFALRFLRVSQRKRLGAVVAYLEKTPFTLSPCEVMPYRLIQRFYKGMVDVFLADECHELKGEETAQGLAFGCIANVASFTNPLTGTLLGGYAQDAHPLLQRIAPAMMDCAGYGYGKGKEYQRDEGVLEEVKIMKVESDELSTARGGKSNTRLKKKPGYSPLAVVRDLLPVAAFIRLEDLQNEVAEIAEASGGKLRLLPSYREVFLSVPMSSEMKEAYTSFQNQFKSFMFEMTPSGRSKTTHAMLYAPDMPDQSHEITWEKEDKIYSIKYSQVCDESQIQPKEKEMLNLVERELGEGRRVMLFATYTNTHDVTVRMLRILQDNGINAVRLRGQVSTAEREAWINKQVEKGVQVIIANPAAVMTGLDLIHFPTLAFMQTGYSTYVLRQAARRAWRIGQQHACRVYFCCYAGTAQEMALAFMGDKQRVSLNAEGDLSESALDSVAEADDGLAAISRAISQNVQISLTSSISSIDDDYSDDEYLATIDHVPTPADLERARNGGTIQEENITEDLMHFGLFALVEDNKESAKQESDDSNIISAEPVRVEPVVQNDVVKKVANGEPVVESTQEEVTPQDDLLALFSL